MANPPKNTVKRIRNVKRCPDCFAHIPVDAKVCTECFQKVGEPDADGLAKKPFNWKGYLSMIVAWILLGWYVWWAFLKN